MYRAIRTWKLKSAASRSSWTELAADTVREANMRSGSRGLAVRAWRMRKAARRAIDALADPAVCAEAQPQAAASTMV